MQNQSMRYKSKIKNSASKNQSTEKTAEITVLFAGVVKAHSVVIQWSFLFLRYFYIWYFYDYFACIFALVILLGKHLFLQTFPFRIL